MCLGLPNAAAWAGYGLVAGALVNNLTDCMCYCQFDVDCGCFLMIYAFECSIWFSRQAVDLRTTIEMRHIRYFRWLATSIAVRLQEDIKAKASSVVASLR